MSDDDNVTVKGCGCLYRNFMCEYLCPTHKDEFVLKLYNERQMMHRFPSLAIDLPKSALVNYRLKDTSTVKV